MLRGAKGMQQPPCKAPARHSRALCIPTGGAPGRGGAGPGDGGDERGAGHRHGAPRARTPAAVRRAARQVRIRLLHGRILASCCDRAPSALLALRSFSGVGPPGSCLGMVQAVVRRI